MNSVELTRLIARLADDKKAVDPVALDMRELVGYTDFILVVTAGNDRQAQAIHDEVYERLKKDHGRLPVRSEGARGSGWVLLDYLDTIFHIFTPETRDRYRLEQLWGEAERLDLELPDPINSSAGGDSDAA